MNALYVLDSTQQIQSNQIMDSQKIDIILESESIHSVEADICTLNEESDGEQSLKRKISK